LHKEKVGAVASILKVRSKTLVEMAEAARFCFSDDIQYEKKGDDKFLKQDVVELFESLARRVEAMPEFNQGCLEVLFTEFLEAEQITLKRLAQPLRVALTGKTASPGIFEVMEVLGKEKVIERIRNAIDHIKGKKDA